METPFLVNQRLWRQQVSREHAQSQVSRARVLREPRIPVDKPRS